MDKKMNRTFNRVIWGRTLWGAYLLAAVMLLPACHQGPPKRIPDLSIRRITVGDVQLAVKEDKSWLKEPENDLVGFRIRIDYPSGKTFSMQQNSLIDFGLQDNFFLSADGDTVKPVFFQRIANGTANQAEYVVAFEPRKGLSGVAVHCSLLFQDPLFGLGNQAIGF
jgi:hypothetical protein